MGEAKRRKKLDKNYGKTKILIEKSSETNNYLIKVNNHHFDSALEYKDALLIVSWLEDRIKKYPLPNGSYDRFCDWMEKNAQDSPKVNAELFVQHGNSVFVTDRDSLGKNRGIQLSKIKQHGIKLIPCN